LSPTRKNWILGSFAAALGGYTLALLLFEWRTSQEAVRFFFQDIYGDTLLKGLNTTICVAFLWGACLLFGVTAWCCRQRSGQEREGLFAISQVLVFFYLACDDRFQIHERIGRQLGVEDAYILVGVGLIEVLLLWRLGGFGRRAVTQRRTVLLAGGLFAAMAFVDAVLPSGLRLRLSVEDLLKTWSCAALLLFAWQTCRTQIAALASAARPQAANPVLITQRAASR